MTARRPTRQMVPHVEAMSDACRQQLITGFDFFGDAYSRDPESDPPAMKQMREDWETHREEMLAEWIAERPGSRPWAWWTFDAVARRETSDGTDHPFDRLERRELCEKWHAEHPAMRHDERFVELFFGVPVICVEAARFETERQYLSRLNLLTSDEQQTKETK